MYESSNTLSKRRLKRMTKRQLKKGHFGPYIKIGIRIRFELSEPINEEDCLNAAAFPRSADWTEDDYLTDWFVDLVEKHRLYCFFHTAPVVEKSLKYEAIIDSDRLGTKSIDQFIGFARALNNQDKVKEVSLVFIDYDRSTEVNGDIKLKELTFELPFKCFEVEGTLASFSRNLSGIEWDLEGFFINPKKNPSWNWSLYRKMGREFEEAHLKGGEALRRCIEKYGALNDPIDE